MLKTSHLLTTAILLFSTGGIANTFDVSKTLCKSAAQTDYLEVYAEKIKGTEDLFKSICQPLVFHRCKELQCDQSNSQDCGTKDQVSQGQFKLEGSMICCSRDYRGMGEAFKTTAYFRNGNFDGHQTELVLNEASWAQIQRACR